MKNNFKPFKVGTIFNPLEGYFDSKRKPLHSKVSIQFPSRLNAMAIDPSKIAKNKNLVYTAGEIVFAVGDYLKVELSVARHRGLEIKGLPSRKPLINHSYLLMKKTLGFEEGFSIRVKNENEIKHAGLGSSGRLISAVAAAINEIFGNPIDKEELMRFLAQNHGEETEKEEYISPVQCMGGSASAGLTKGGLKIILGDSRLIKTMEVHSDYKAVIGIPADYIPPLAEEALKKEVKSLKKFILCGKKYGPLISYRIVHEVLPAMNKGDLEAIGNLIYDYRFKMESIENCSFSYKNLLNLSKKVSILKKRKFAAVLSLSSVGPAFFTITKDPEYSVRVFKKNNLMTRVLPVVNNGYTVRYTKTNKT